MCPKKAYTLPEVWRCVFPSLGKGIFYKQVGLDSTTQPLVSSQAPLINSHVMFLEQNPVLLVSRYLRARESGHQSKLQCMSSSDVPDTVLDARNTEAKRGLSGPTFWDVCGTINR